jgi:hypothetical protein
MDPDGGRFVDESKALPHFKRYLVGEVLKLKDEEFEVVEITPRDIRLRPIAQDPAARLAQLRHEPLPDALNRHDRRVLEALERRGR